MWSTLTTDEALQELTPQELAAINTIKGGQDTFTGILDRAVAEFRSAIFAGGHPLGEEGTLPDGFKSHCIALARWPVARGAWRSAA